MGLECRLTGMKTSGLYPLTSFYKSLVYGCVYVCVYIYMCVCVCVFYIYIVIYQLSIDRLCTNQTGNQD